MPPPSQRLSELKAELTNGVPQSSRLVQSQSSAGPSSGVTATYEAESLFDFVQFECMRGLTRGVHVKAGNDEGVLFFDEGQIVHAETGSLEGQEAALKILSWQTVSIHPCSDVWVSPNSITTSWQGLLMMAAQRLDEAVLETEYGQSDLESDSRLQRSQSDDTFSSLEEFVEFRDSNLIRAVRLDSEGEVITSRGNLQNFPDAASYAVRLAELIGEGLGLERFSGLECVTSTSVMLAYVDEDDLVAVEAESAAEVNQHRKRAGT